MMKKGLLALSIMALVACGGEPTTNTQQEASAENEVSNTEESSLTLDDNQREIKKDSFSGEWALAVDGGILECEDQAVSFTAPDGQVYALNGFGQAYSKNKGLDWHSITPESEIWLDNPDIPGTKVSISNMLNAGLELCENN